MDLKTTNTLGHFEIFKSDASSCIGQQAVILIKGSTSSPGFLKLRCSYLSFPVCLNSSDDELVPSRRGANRNLTGSYL